MSIEAIKAQHQQVQAQIGAVNIQIAQAAVSEIKGLARIAGLRVKIVGRGQLVSKPRTQAPNWSAQELTMVRQFYQTRGAAWLQRELLPNRSIHAIRKRAYIMSWTSLEKRA